MTLFRLTDAEQNTFYSAPEIFPGVQLGYYIDGLDRGYCAVVSGLVAVVIDDKLDGEISDFFDRIWRPSKTRPTSAEILPRYKYWLENLSPAQGGIIEVTTNRPSMYSLLTMASAPPPAPPGRPTLVPGAPLGRGSLPAWASHLPFTTVTQDREVFYRWEAFPGSLRINQTTRTVAQWTFAAPKSEVPFIDTGFSAVARTALPSFFPAVFRWELQPQVGTTILCGAVVPMFTQAGGGVEVCFDGGATNIGPIANQVVIPPL